MAEQRKTMDATSNTKKYQATWESLRHYRVPGWYQDAKFGIFIHWGVYAVPAFGNEWYPRQMYLQGTEEFQHHIATFGPHAQFGYKDFIPLFKGENFNPAAWATLFRQAGARYVVPVAEHHDGFAMYDSSFSRWNAVQMGPQRDVIGELAAAVRRERMVFGLSSHRAEHWWFFNGGMKFESDVRDPAYFDLYGPAMGIADDLRDRNSQPPPTQEFLEDWLARTGELVDRYQPQLIYFDWWIDQHVFEPYLRRFAADYYNRGAGWEQGVVINYKHEAFPDGTAVLDVERGQLTGIRPLYWQTDTAVSQSSWGYITQPEYRTAGALIDDLVDIVSKNGNLLLNIGPRPDGTIPEPEQAILLEMGQWLAVNGEAIYNTRPWTIFGEGPTQVPEGEFTDRGREPFTGQDLRFTVRDDALYAIALDWPGEELVIKSMASGSDVRAERISEIMLLGSPARINWSQDEEGLHVMLPADKPCQHAFALKLRLKM
jgi:alpha-L-fucosidase